VQRALYISHLILNSPIHGTWAYAFKYVIHFISLISTFLLWGEYYTSHSSTQECTEYWLPSSSMLDNVRTAGHVPHPKLLNGFRINLAWRTHIKTINMYAVKICMFHLNRFWVTYLIRTHKTDKIVQCAKEVVQKSQKKSIFASK
jgi:hypothetical protein